MSGGGAQQPQEIVCLVRLGIVTGREHFLYLQAESAGELDYARRYAEAHADIFMVSEP
jgi:hypothetical protein